MATVLESLKSINAYPVPLRTLVETAEHRGLDVALEATQEVMCSNSYLLAKADLLKWLSLAPDITQGGISYGFTDDQRLDLRRQANMLYENYEKGNYVPKSIYGYKGSRL